MRPGIGLIGKKLGMTQVFSPEGRPVPVTVLEAGPCTVVTERTQERDGYRAVQMGFGECLAKELSKPLSGHFTKANAAAKRVLREFRLAPVAGASGSATTRPGSEEKAQPGSTVTVEIFKPGDRVDVTGRSIGKGFSGGMKRWHWKGGKRTHGSTTHRRPGSIGSSTDPSRVFKGHHLPGRMGDRTVTTQALVVVQVDPQQNLLLLKGSVPGSNDGILLIRRSRKGPKLAAPKPASKKKAVVQPSGGKPAAGGRPAAGAKAPAAKGGAAPAPKKK